jgi:hypothetical protein
MAIAPKISILIVRRFPVSGTLAVLPFKLRCAVE